MCIRDRACPLSLYRYSPLRRHPSRHEGKPFPCCLSWCWGHQHLWNWDANQSLPTKKITGWGCPFGQPPFIRPRLHAFSLAHQGQLYYRLHFYLQKACFSIILKIFLDFCLFSWYYLNHNFKARDALKGKSTFQENLQRVAGWCKAAADRNRTDPWAAFLNPRMTVGEAGSWPLSIRAVSMDTSSVPAKGTPNGVKWSGTAQDLNLSSLTKREERFFYCQMCIRDRFYTHQLKFSRITQNVPSLLGVQ